MSVSKLAERRTTGEEIEGLGRIIEVARKAPFIKKAKLAEKAVEQAFIIIRRQQDDIALIRTQLDMIEGEFNGGGRL